MGMGMTSTSTQVTISGGVTTAPVQLITGQTRVTQGSSIAVINGTTAVYAVTAGKTLYVTSMQIDSISNAGGAEFGIRDNTTGANKLYFQLRTGIGNTTQACMDFPVPLAFVHSIQTSGNGNCTMGISFQGYEQ